jgi:putative transposase
LVAAERSRPDVARRRAQWIARQGLIDPARLAFIDETCTKTNMAPLRGWAPRGQRIRSPVPHGHWKTMTFLAALRHDRIEAPWLIDGPINGERFRLYVETVLAPTLKPGDIVIMDNLGSHKSKAVRAAIRAASARLLFLPKYSPDPRLRGDKPEPHRTVLRQAQTPPAQAGGTNRRSRMRRHRTYLGNAHPNRVRKLLRKRRI